MFSEFLDKYVDNDYIKKINGSYFTENGFMFRTQFSFSDNHKTIAVHIWSKKDDYAIRISSFPCDEHIYFLKWPGNVNYFRHVLEKYINRHNDVYKIMKELLDIVLYKNYFGLRYGLI